jgi:Zn-dependent protease with chaperone function
MFNLTDVGRMLIFFGIILILSGLFFMLAGKVPYLGKLPGDIAIHTKKFHFYLPLATSLIISLLLTIIINLFLRHK